MNIIEKRRKEAIIDSYYFRLMAKGVDLEKGQLQEKFNYLNEQELSNSFMLLMNGKKDDVINNLSKFHIQAVDKEITLNNLKEQVKKSLNLSSITEFTDNKNDYFKFKSSDGRIFIVRNIGNDSKQLFMDILNNKNIVSNSNGAQNTEEIFRFLKDKKFININIENSTSVNESKYTKSQISLIREIEQQFPGKQVVVGMKENLYIVKGNASEDDIILSATIVNGKYKLSALQQKSYGAKPDENKTKDNVQKNNEVPNDVIIELENNQEIVQTIENNLNMNLSDEEISANTLEVINSKFPSLRTIPNLTVIIMALINRRRKNRQNINNRGRQLVLTNNPYNNNRVA